MEYKINIIGSLLEIIKNTLDGCITDKIITSYEIDQYTRHADNVSWDVYCISGDHQGWHSTSECSLEILPISLRYHVIKTKITHAYINAYNYIYKTYPQHQDILFISSSIIMLPLHDKTLSVNVYLTVDQLIEYLVSKIS